MFCNTRSTFFSALLGLALWAALGAVGAATAAPAQRNTNVAAVDCAGCHDKTQVLPTKHKSIKAMKWADCLECHERKDPESTLAGKLPAAHAHALAGESCASCHGQGKPEAVSTAQCVQCHALDKLVVKTSSIKPKNPHTSPHYGKELDCDNCHIQHGKSVNFCNDCHEFKFSVP